MCSIFYDNVLCSLVLRCLCICSTVYMCYKIMSFQVAVMIYAAAILKGQSTSRSSSSGMLSTLLSSRAVRMSPRLANKRTAQLQAPQPPSPAKWRTCKKENTMIPASSSANHIPSTSGYQSNRSSRSKKAGGGAKVSASNKQSKQGGRRASALCKHRSYEVCNNCTHRYVLWSHDLSIKLLYFQ